MTKRESEVYYVENPANSEKNFFLYASERVTPLRVDGNRASLHTERLRDKPVFSH